MLQTVERVTGSILWANLHLLFWLSLFPFATAWLGESQFFPIPLVAYGFILSMAAIAYWILQTTIIKDQGAGSLLSKAVGGDIKSKLSPILYVVAMVSANWLPWLADAIYVTVALIWLVSDRRIERVIN